MVTYWERDRSRNALLRIHKQRICQTSETSLRGGNPGKLPSDKGGFKPSETPAIKGKLIESRKGINTHAHSFLP